jgi:hypothetical protein
VAEHPLLSLLGVGTRAHRHRSHRRLLAARAGRADCSNLCICKLVLEKNIQIALRANSLVNK